MKIDNGRIVEASESELWQYYLERDLDDVYSFADYFDRMKDAGVKIVEKPKPTIGDKIRQMSNVEIAAVMCGLLNSRDKGVLEALLNYLNAPAESEGWEDK